MTRRADSGLLESDDHAGEGGAGHGELAGDEVLERTGLSGEVVARRVVVAAERIPMHLDDAEILQAEEC